MAEDRFKIRGVVEQLAMAAYIVPVDRVTPLITRRLTLDTVPVGDGEGAVVIGAVGRLRLGATGSWMEKSPVRLLAAGACVKYGKDAGVHLFRTSLSPEWMAALLRVASPTVTPCRWDLDEWGGRGIRVKVGRNPLSQASLTLKRGEDPAEGEDGPIQAASLPGDRTRLYFFLRGHYFWMVPYQEVEMKLEPCAVEQVRFPTLAELGLLSEAEIERPAAAFALASAVSVTASLPQPVAWPWQAWTADED